MEQVIKECNQHGNSVFSLRKDGRYRCRKCSVDAVQRRRVELKRKAIEYMGGQCKVCGYNKCKGALIFHHLDSNEKEFGISAKGYTRTWESVKAELDKCIMVCANCHAEIHEEWDLNS